jgi:hypothetical protein
LLYRTGSTHQFGPSSDEFLTAPVFDEDLDLEVIHKRAAFGGG